MGKEYWYVDILLVIDTDTRTRPRPRTSNTKAHSKDFCYGKVSRCEGRVTRSRFIYYIKTEMHPAGLFCRGGGTTGWGSQRGIEGEGKGKGIVGGVFILAPGCCWCRLPRGELPGLFSLHWTPFDLVRRRFCRHLHSMSVFGVRVARLCFVVFSY